MKLNITSEEMDKAKEEYEQEQKQKFVDMFEKDGVTRTDYIVKSRGDGKEFIYGVPVLENKKLQGFNMMKFDKIYNERGKAIRSDDVPYVDKDGKQVFMTVDEYLKLRWQMDLRNGNWIINQRRKDEAVEQKVLNNSKLGRVRTKLAKKLGVEEKLPKKLKMIEKALSDKILGRVKD